MAAASYFDQVQKLYIAYFGRPADPTGLNFWAANIDAVGGNLPADNSVPTQGTNVQQSTGGKLTFHANDNTLALKVAALQADTELKAINTIAFFENGANTYVYYSGATTATADDQLIELTGVSGLKIINGGLSAVFSTPV